MTEDTGGAALARLFGQDAADVTSMPPDERVRRIADSARELVEATALVADLEAKLATAKAARKVLAHETLPALFDGAGTDRIGLPEGDVDVVVRPYYHAVISAEDTEPARLDAAFDHLEALGGGDLVRTRLTVTFGRGDLATARRLADVCREWIRADRRAPDETPVVVDRSIPWNTLTSFVREWFERRDAALEEDGADDPPAPDAVEIDLDLLNAQVGRVCKIEQRRSGAKKSRRR